MGQGASCRSMSAVRNTTTPPKSATPPKSKPRTSTENSSDENVREQAPSTATATSANRGQADSAQANSGDPPPLDTARDSPADGNAAHDDDDQDDDDSQDDNDDDEGEDDDDDNDDDEDIPTFEGGARDGDNNNNNNNNNSGTENGGGSGGGLDSAVLLALLQAAMGNGGGSATTTSNNDGDGDDANNNNNNGDEQEGNQTNDSSAARSSTAATTTTNSNGSAAGTPLQLERMTEETRFDFLTSSSAAAAGRPKVITKVAFYFDRDDDFNVIMRGNERPDRRYLICVVLRDHNNLSKSEVTAMKNVLQLCERGTELTEELFGKWANALRGEGDIGTRHDEEEDVMIINFRPKVDPTDSDDDLHRDDEDNVDGLEEKKTFNLRQLPGAIQKTSFGIDDDGDATVVLRTDTRVFFWVINLTVKNNSFSHLELQATADVLSTAGRGNKMDESVFLQIASRLRRKYKVINTIRDENDGAMGLHLVPSYLSRQDAGLFLPSKRRPRGPRLQAFDIPNSNARDDAEWSEETSVRVISRISSDLRAVAAIVGCAALPEELWQETREKEEALKAKGDVHIGFRCDGCHRRPIVGLRYRCMECEDFDLCHSCYMRDVEVLGHKRDHAMKKIKTSERVRPKTEGQKTEEEEQKTREVVEEEMNEKETEAEKNEEEGEAEKNEEEAEAEKNDEKAEAEKNEEKAEAEKNEEEAEAEKNEEEGDEGDVIKETKEAQEQEEGEEEDKVADQVATKEKDSEDDEEKKVESLDTTTA